MSKDRRGQGGFTGGFTIVEMSVVIAAISILAALLVPVVLNQVERARISAAREDVSEVAKTLKRFHDDSGYWPFQNELWSGQPEWPTQQVDPGPFTTGDTAMFGDAPPINPVATESPLPMCASVQPGISCYNGPYLGNGGSMGAPANHDPWGNPFYFTYIRPSDTWGGGTAGAPDGAIVVWSLGPDGVDETGCSSGGCGYDITRVVSGNSSVPFCDDRPDLATPSCSDDIVQFVGTAM